MADRNKKGTIVYLNSNGDEVKLTSGDVAAICWRFANKEERIRTMSDFDNFVRGIATVRGLAEVGRDSYADADTVEEAVELLDDRLMTLDAGEWYSGRKGEGGPKISWFIEAVKTFKTGLAAERGLAYDPATDEPALRDRYVGKDKHTARQKALDGNAGLRAEYERTLERAAQDKALRATERRAKAEALASTSTSGDGMSL